MLNKRKICIVTGTRAEYGLLYWLIKGVSLDETLELQLVVTGMHLSPEFGLTYKEIESDGFKISKKVEILLSSDTEVGISKSMGLAMISFAEAYAELDPDIVVLLGDRFEIFAAASSAMISRLPIAHCHGGEATEGLIDEAIRHSITKMAQVHFTSTEEYRKRVIQLGENPKLVFNVGALGIENINKLDLLSRNHFEKSIGFKLGSERNFLVTFHPVTLENSTAKSQFYELLAALDKIENSKIIFTKANADTDGRIINEMIDVYVKGNPEKSVAFTSLGRLRYLSALKYIDVVIGNSSSGLIEVPSFKKSTINIGDRQNGRVKAESVVDCNPLRDEIERAILGVLSDSFLDKLKKIENPYGVSNPSVEIIQVLKDIQLEGLIKKQFYNINF